MKVCTKCKRDLPIEAFSRNRNKRDGFYPSCKECEAKHKQEWRDKNPMCFRCKTNPHTPGCWLCQDCQRKALKRGPRTRTARKTDLHLCKRCSFRLREYPSVYCKPCKLEWQREHRLKKWKAKLVARQIDPEERRRQNAASYATGLLHCGKIRRGPCVFCGKQGTQFHHYDYEDRTRNFDDVCYPCHLRVHRFLRIMLTVKRISLIGQ